MMKYYKSVDEFFAAQDQWQKELLRLREILLATGLHEELKWSIPNYLHGKKLVVGISGFKDYFGLWFHQGALLADKQGVLINAQEGKTKALRQWRMARMKDIKSRTIQAYVKESVALLEKGVEIKPDRNKPLVIPRELVAALKKNKLAHAKFDKLNKTRTREFAEYISDAKRPETKLKRLEKILPMILDGVGLNDKYRKS